MFPKKITKPKTTRIDGSTKGTEETAFNNFFPGKFFVARSHAPGKPSKTAKIVLTVAWKTVNIIIRRLYEDDITSVIFFRENPFPCGKRALLKTREMGR